MGIIYNINRQREGKHCARVLQAERAFYGGPARLELRKMTREFLGGDVLRTWFRCPKAVPAEIVQRLERAVAEAMHDPELAEANPADVPMLAYLSGAQWQESLKQNRKVLQGLVDQMPK